MTPHLSGEAPAARAELPLIRLGAALVVLLLMPVVCERTLYGYVLALMALLALTCVLAMVQSLLLPLGRGTRMRRLCNALALLALSILLTHLMAFAAYSDGGTLYLGTAALVRAGTVTPLGHGFAALQGTPPMLALLLLTWREDLR